MFQLNFRLWAFLYFRSSGNRLLHSHTPHRTKVLEPLLAFLQFLPHFIPSTSRLLLTQSLPLGEHHIYVSLVLFIPPLMEPIRIMPTRIKYLFNIDMRSIFTHCMKIWLVSAMLKYRLYSIFCYSQNS